MAADVLNNDVERLIMRNLWLSLPKVLLVHVLLFATLATSKPLATSSNDPLHDIAKLVQKQPDPPVCCLVPLPSSEPTEEILTFEDWKAKQLQLHAVGGKEVPPIVNSQEPLVDSSSIDVVEIPSSSPHEQPSHSSLFKVPVIDRFDYANSDCSARVHNSHRSAKSPSSILSSKKDRYMLSPCNTPGEEKFVVIELCDDIRIDTVQLANFEFFSGVFKDFSVSVARTYTSDTEGWTDAGTYRAKNNRAIQVR